MDVGGLLEAGVFSDEVVLGDNERSVFLGKLLVKDSEGVFEISDDLLGGGDELFFEDVDLSDESVDSIVDSILLVGEDSVGDVESGDEVRLQVDEGLDRGVNSVVVFGRLHVAHGEDHRSDEELVRAAHSRSCGLHLLDE